MTKHVLTVSSTGPSTVVIVVAGELDADAARALLRTAAVAASSGAARVEIDLHAITGASLEALLAITACRRLSAQLPDGLGFRVSRLGQQLLLASMSRDDRPVAMSGVTA
jgi:hypothetical protein